MNRPSRHIDAAVDAIDAALLDYEGQRTTEAEYTTDFHPDRCARCQRHATDDGRDMCQPCVDWLNGADIDDPATIKTTTVTIEADLSGWEDFREAVATRCEELWGDFADAFRPRVIPADPFARYWFGMPPENVGARQVQGSQGFWVSEELWNAAIEPAEPEPASPIERVQQMRQRQREARERGLRIDHRRGRQ